MIFTLPPKTKKLWQTHVALSVAFLSLLILFLCYSCLLCATLLIVLFVMGFFTSFVYMPRYFKSYKISIANKQIVINRGILIKKTIFLSLQHVSATNCIKTPYLRLFGLNIMVFKASRVTLRVAPLDSAQIECIYNVIYGIDNEV